MKALVNRLGLDHELAGHTGCVNCLEWNWQGSVIASGSDDFHVRLWDPFKCKVLDDIDTGHQGNIFSVKVAIFYQTYLFTKFRILFLSSLCPSQMIY